MSWLKAATSSDSDVFDEEMDDLSLQNKEWRCNMEKRSKDGYRDGVDAGKEASLQVGFNLGYREGALSMKAIGQLKGVVSALQCWCQSQASRSSELPAITELLQRVERYEQDLVEAMRRAQERPVSSVREVAGDLEDLGLGRREDDSNNCTDVRAGDGDCCGRDVERNCSGQERNTIGNSIGIRFDSNHLLPTAESLEQMVQTCVELVAEMRLPGELKHHIQQLRYIRVQTGSD